MYLAMNKRPAHKLSLVVQYASDAQNLPSRSQLRRWVKAALQHDVSMTLRIVDEAEGRTLNKSYRGKSYATNVLTFVYDDKEQTPDITTSHSTRLSKDDSQVAGYPGLPNPSRPPLVRGGAGKEQVSPPDKGGWGVAFQPLYGDVVICAPVVETEAREQHKDLMAHYAHLAIHAALHLQGYDHENEAEAEAMEAMESAIMLKLRRPDPYQITHAANGRTRK